MNWFLEEEDAPKPWTLADIYADLAQVNDIAEYLDVRRIRVVWWIKRRETTGFPEPIRRWTNIHLYSLEECKAWFERWEAKHRKGTKWTDGAMGYAQERPEYEHDWVEKDQ